MKTVVIGASTNPSRYSFKATNMLLQYNHEVIPIGIKKGNIEGLEILNNKPQINDIDTVTLYVSAKNQIEYYDYIINVLNPRRIIFNPGTENDELEKLAKEKNIEVSIACTLVLLSTNQY